MKHFKYLKALRALLTFALSITLATPQFAFAEVPPGRPVSSFKAFSAPPKDLVEARVTIEAAERRVIADFKAPTASADFSNLVKANQLTGLIAADAVEGYLKYFRDNQQKLMADGYVDGQPLNWQLFLAQTYIMYQIEKTNAENRPNALIALLRSIANNPHVEQISFSTWAFIIGVVLFVKGVAYGAMVAGPGATAVNSGLNPIMTPLNQKLTVIGLKYLGPAGMWLNWLLFERKLEKQAKQVVGELKTAGEVIDTVRNLVEGRHYQMTGTQWAENRSVMLQAWNRVQFLFGLVPDAYRGGRNLQIDLAVFRARDFAQAATNSLNAAEVQRQGVEQIIDRLIQRGGNASALEAAVQVSTEVASQQVTAERETPLQASSLDATVEQSKAKLVELGATRAQAERIFENLRNQAAFTRQAATMLAAQTLNDAMFADTIEGVRSLYEVMFKNTALNHLHGTMKFEVIEILKKMKFQVEVRQADIALEMQARQTITAPERLKELTTGRDASRVLAEPGSLTQEPAKTSEQRARDAARGAARK